jgi:glyoxylase-like metal-dependent hydrolase (beta-lactamase superfamily II)
MKILRVVALVVLALLVLGFVASRYYLGSEAVPATSDYALDLAELRRQAEALPGAKPLAVHEELVADAGMPAAAIFAGESFDPWPMVHRVFQVRFADGKTVVIDASMGPDLFAQMNEMTGDGTFYPEAFARVEDALATADLVVFTHEHSDHTDGAARHPDTARLAERVRFNAAQLANTEQLDSVSMPAALREAEPLDVTGPLLVAPGVVLVPAAGHTPGSQLVFVTLADGRELLFIGDVAWDWRGIEEEIYRPRLVTNLMLGEDREAVLAQYRRLKDLSREEPELAIVVSHDTDQRKAFLDEGLLVEGFPAP